MNKILTFLAACTLALTFTACEDVPSPYEVPNKQPSKPTEKDLLLEESFSASLGSFTNYTTSGAGAWKIDFKTAKAAGFDNATKTTTAGTYYLVGPELDLTNVEAAHVTLDYILRYNKGNENQQLLISDNFDASKPDQGWTVLNQTWTEGADWKTFANANVNIPKEWMGKKIRIAFRYNTNATSGSTWEIKNLKIQRGSGSSQPNTPPHPNDQNTFIDEAFTTTLGSFTNHTTSGSGAWKIDFKTAKAAGYDNATKKTMAGTYYIVSSEVDLAGVEAAHVALDYILRYNKGNENQQLLITANYNESTPAKGWTVLNQTWTEGTDWKNFSHAEINLPQEWLGKKVRIAFRYSTNETSGSTWQIKNVKLLRGAASSPNPSTPSQPDQPDPPVNPPTPGSNLLTNGDFETWSNNLPTGWKTTSTAGNATLTQSTTAHGGTYSVKVGHDAKYNKRIGYQEMKLKAGTYTFSFYIHADDAKAKYRAGYAVVTDGKIKDYKKDYVYGGSTAVPTGTWTLVTHTFKLDKASTICLLVMNQKGGADFYIDDASLSTSDGGIDQ